MSGAATRRGSSSSSSGEGGSSSSGRRGSGNINNRGESVVVDCGRRKSTCGYCKSSSRTSISCGLWANSLTVDDYQDLLDRGWRRSGCFLYKPDMERTCCPSYTIRLKANDFTPNKEQLKVSRRMERFLGGMLDPKRPVEHVEDVNTSRDRCSCFGQVASSVEESSSVTGEIKMQDQIMHHLSNQIENAVQICVENNELPSGIQLPNASVKNVAQAKRKIQVLGSEDLTYTSNIAFQIAATLRRVLSTNQSGTSNHSAEENDLSPKTIAEKLASHLIQQMSITRQTTKQSEIICPPKPWTETYGLSVRACNGHINYYSTANQAPKAEDAKMVAASKDSSTGCRGKRCFEVMSDEHPQAKRHRLEIHLKRSSFDPEEYALYRRYQIKVHNDAPDQVTESSYKRFLVDTPLVFVPSSGDCTVPPCGFGSFHQQYVVDGKLIAVGVVDILPKCLSSKYLFWDPDYAFLSLGKYSALQEISWVKENQTHCSSLQFYYLGYYIHSCPKMRYKAAYNPSELLCPLRYQWVHYDIARPLLDRKKYVILSDFVFLQNGDASAPQVSESVKESEHENVGEEERNDACMDADEEMTGPESESTDDESDPETSDLTSDELESGDISDILIGVGGTSVRYKNVQRAFSSSARKYLESQLHRYQRAVGTELSKRMIYSVG